MHPEALILRRCHPVPVTFADLRAAYLKVRWLCSGPRPIRKQVSSTYSQAAGATLFAAALKQVTGALDEVYAVVDGREVRVAVIDSKLRVLCDNEMKIGAGLQGLLEVADEQGYWERPHEVRLDLSPRPVSHDEVARAVLVGQEYVERHGNR